MIGWRCEGVAKRDGKGRCKVARIHDVPLISAALETLHRLLTGSVAP